MAERGLRVLSLCGGGTRGVIALVYLQKIEDIVGPLHQFFDVFCGTSTGGLIAVALGLMKWPVKDVMKLYDEFATKIFPNKFIQGLNKVSEGAKAEAADFEAFLTEKLGKETLNSYASKDFPKVFVTTTLSKQTPDLQILCNFPLTPNLQARYNHLSEAQIENIRLVDALQATTAAPIYFPPLILGDKTFKDGGLLANNPSLIALEIVRENWKDRGLGLLVSIGTGFTKNAFESVKADTQSAASTVLMQTLHLATNSEKTHKEVKAHLDSFASFYKLNYPSHYIWLNCEIPASLAGLSETDPEKLRKLQEIARQDAESETVTQQLAVLLTN